MPVDIFALDVLLKTARKITTQRHLPSMSWESRRSRRTTPTTRCVDPKSRASRSNSEQLLEGVRAKVFRKLCPPKAGDPMEAFPLEVANMIMSYLEFHDIV